MNKFNVGDLVRVIATEDQLAEISVSDCCLGKPLKIKGIDKGIVFGGLECLYMLDYMGTLCFLPGKYLELVPRKLSISQQFQREQQQLSTKDTNPKDSAGIRKVPTWFTPTAPMLEVGLAFMEGARKYGAGNWRKAGVRASVYYDAVNRHLNAFKEGQDIDPDSGLPHLIKAVASLLVLRDSQIMGNWVDDRPIKYPNGLDMDELNKKASDIIDKYPDCAKPFLETDNNE